MTDTHETAAAVAEVAKSIGMFAVKSAAQTAAEVAGAVLILAAAGATVNAVQTRRAKKLARKTETTEK